MEPSTPPESPPASPPPIPPPVPLGPLPYGQTAEPASQFYQQVAKGSWLMPVMACFISFLSQSGNKDQNTPRYITLTITAVLGLMILGGFVLGLIGLYGAYVKRQRGVASSAIIGTVLSAGLIALVAVPVMYLSITGNPKLRAAAMANRQAQLAQAQKEGEDAFLLYDGWLGTFDREPGMLAIASFADDSAAVTYMRSLYTVPVSVLVLNYDNAMGTQPVTVDLASCQFVLEDGKAIPSIPSSTLQRAATTAEGTQVASTPSSVTVEPGGKMVGRIIFLPPGTDWSRCSHAVLNIDGQPVKVPGSIITAAEKAELVNLGKASPPATPSP